jgi:hypothetical protein
MFFSPVGEKMAARPDEGANAAVHEKIKITVITNPSP